MRRLDRQIGDVLNQLYALTLAYATYTSADTEGEIRIVDFLLAPTKIP